MLGLAGAVFTTAVAHAHPTVTSGPAVANKTQDVTFGIGHGCEGLDTYRIEIEIPTGVTGVRPLASNFGRATVASDDAGAVTSVTWQKADEDVLDADTGYYTFTLHLRTPDRPFTRQVFRTHQTCRAADGTLVTVDWVALPGAQTGEPAPTLLVVPARMPGWNKYAIGEHITDPSVFFQDAQIVWRGSAAYSANPNTAAQITATPGVTALTDGIHPGDEIWVKY
jgi:hypothetical protein